jgi:hypothetical protein
MRRNDKPNCQISWQQKVKSLTFVRYADDFVLIHKDLNVVRRCRDLISEWLKDIGLELKPSKTRIAHTKKIRERGSPEAKRYLYRGGNATRAVLTERIFSHLLGRQIDINQPK